MPNISDSLMARNFVAALETAESYGMALSEWESNFVKSLRQSFEGREDQIDLGLNPWNPTANQWNTLKEIAEKYR